MGEIQSKNIRFIHFDSIESTQKWAKKNAELLNPEEFTCITASKQTEGFGRQHRPWVSTGDDLYASFYFTLPKEADYLAHLAQLLSFSCAKVLKNKGFDPLLKWPNDILLAGKKVAGVICDIQEHKGKNGIIMGIGMNINREEKDLELIDQPATSLFQISGLKWNIRELLSPLIFQFLNDLDELNEKGVASFQVNYQKFT
jgi:BirA family transcriptional regulator, biotin operon repressor / biotin---[acetyl-CoA-carboxylase] ligase